MKFIHSSDWHIGRLFQHISLLDDQLYVLEQLKAYIEEHAVDALIISGDIFDRSVPPPIAIDVLDHFFHRLITELKISIIIISGNHDNAKRLRFGARQMQSSGLYILTDIHHVSEPIRLSNAQGECVDIYGIPYHEPVEVREAYQCDVKSYDEAHTFLVNRIKVVRQTDIPSILMSHCFIDGAEESDSERPQSIGGLDRVNYESLQDFTYVALGHLHAPQYKGVKHIRYSGSLLKYSFSEYKQKKAVTLIEFNATSLVSMRQLALIALHNVRIIQGKLNWILEQAQSDIHQDDYILVRLEDEYDLLDPMGQLRKFYTNVLQLEFTKLTGFEGRVIVNTGKQYTERDVFNDFFQQVVGHELSREQHDLVSGIIDEARDLLENDF